MGERQGYAFDRFEHHLKGRGQRGSIRDLAGITRRAVRLTRRASPRLFALTIVLQAGAAVLLAAQVLLGRVALEAVFDADAGDGSFEAALPSLIGLLAATAAASFAGSALTQVQRLLGERVVRLTWGSILDVTTSVDLATFESPSFFDQLERVQSNALMRPLTLVQGLMQMLGGAIAVLGLSVALVAISPVLLPILLCAGVPLAFLSRLSGRLEFAFAVAQTTASRERLYLIELLTARDHAKEVRAFGLGGHFRRRWDESYAGYLADLRAHVRRLLVYAGFGSLSSVVVLGAASGLLIYLVAEDRISLASAGAALIATRLLSSRVEAIFKGVTGLFESALYLRDHEEFTSSRLPSAAPDAGGDGRAAQPLASLEIDGVGFRYPEDGREVLQDISLTVHGGQVVALVGENGSGKTTLAKLIAGLFEPVSGSIRWNGTDVSDLGPEALRAEIAVIFQDFVRYVLSARENIVAGDIDRAGDADAMREAARRAGVDDAIAELPAGYDTALGRLFGGVDLSLGQWQRMALARAFFRDASLLILDEPTASLDPRAEAALFDRVRELAGGRTVLLISHRFSTVRSADQIVVLHDGRIEEQGTHDDLMGAGGRYAELFELQAVAYR